MAVAMRQSKRFPAPSPVTRYWLANCVGFSLAGGGHGTVERVLADENPHEASELEVRTSRHRVQRVPTSAVIAVVPQEQVLVVDHRRRYAMPDWRRDARVRLLWSARVAKRMLIVTLGLLAVLAAEAWVLARRGGSEVVRLVRSLPWQSYGRSARSATTRLLQARSSRSSRRRTTSSGRSNSRNSAD